MTCYQVLAAHADPRAFSLLQQGYELLQHDAATLDEVTRQRFLEVVPTNRTLIAAYQAWRAQGDRAILITPQTAVSNSSAARLEAFQI